MGQDPLNAALTASMDRVQTVEEFLEDRSAMRRPMLKQVSVSESEINWRHPQ